MNVQVIFFLWIENVIMFWINRRYLGNLLLNDTVILFSAIFENIFLKFYGKMTIYPCKKHFTR